MSSRFVDIGFSHVSLIDLVNDGDEPKVSSTKQRSRLGSRVVKKPKLKSLFSYLRKGEGEPCEQGETAENTGCIPASGEGHNKPTEDEERRKAKEQIEEDLFVSDPKVVEQIATWTDSDGKYDYEQTVSLQEVEYDSPYRDGPDKVYRWISHDEEGDEKNKGDWTANADQARSEGMKLARNQGQEEDSEDKDISHYKKPNEELPDDARPALSKSELKSITTYTSNTGNAFEQLNRMLRSGNEPKGALAPIFKDLRNVLSRLQTFDKPVKVYRGLEWSASDNEQEQKRDFIAMLDQSKGTGKPLKFAGFISTSTNEFIAASTGNQVLFEIEAVQGLDVKSFSLVPEEGELLIDHNSQFVVEEVTDKGEEGLRVRLRQVVTEGR